MAAFDFLGIDESSQWLHRGIQHLHAKTDTRGKQRIDRTNKSQNQCNDRYHQQPVDRQRTDNHICGSENSDEKWKQDNPQGQIAQCFPRPYFAIADEPLLIGFVVFVKKMQDRLNGAFFVLKTLRREFLVFQLSRFFDGATRLLGRECGETKTVAQNRWNFGGHFFEIGQKIFPQRKDDFHIRSSIRVTRLPAAALLLLNGIRHAATHQLGKLPKKDLTLLRCVIERENFLELIEYQYRR